jgi:hypothetical protein
MIDKIYSWYARRKLIGRYRYLNEVNKILEQYLTQRIMTGGSQEFVSTARKDLGSKQGEIKENQNFINFLKGI